MIEVLGVNKSYRQLGRVLHILRDVNLEISRGKILGVIGKSGAGKTTLIRCLNLLERPDSGSIFIDGIDLTVVTPKHLRKMRQQIGMIFQGVNLLNSKTVFDNIALPLKLLGEMTRVQIRARVLELLDLVGLNGFENKYPLNLSGGQKQRVGIARALAPHPKVLLSDEGTSALDTQATNSILDLLQSINEKLGLTIVLITHEINVVRRICDEVAVIDDGRIIEHGNVLDVMLHPKEAATRKLLLEEETDKYLDQVSNYYTFVKSPNNHLIILSFIGDQTFEPILSRISRESGIEFSILRGELDHIKRTPFGQLLLELKGREEQLAHAFEVIKSAGLHYELLH